MMNLFETGELSDLLGIEVLDVGALVESQLVAKPKVINLSQWFQNNFVEAIQEAWLTTADILGIRRIQEAFRSNTVQRAKQIQLGDRTLALTLDLEKQEDQSISLFLGTYPLQEQAYLPEDLKLTIFFESGEPVELLVNEDREGFKEEISFSPGEEFSVQVTSGDDSLTEYFEF